MVSPNITNQQRSAFYALAFPGWPAPRADDRWLDGMWILGNDYRNKSSLHGAYPPNYIKRVVAMFPEAERILHLFSGSLTAAQTVEYHQDKDVVRFDLIDRVGDGIVQGNAEQLGDYFDRSQFDLILADPPYTGEDADKYGTPMVKRQKVFRQIPSVLCHGGNLVWLDQMLPMYNKEEMWMWGAIGIVRSTNHRFRVASFFECKR